VDLTRNQPPDVVVDVEIKDFPYKGIRRANNGFIKGSLPLFPMKSVCKETSIHKKT
jgi:hypothetical protein